MDEYSIQYIGICTANRQPNVLSSPDPDTIPKDFPVGSAQKLTDHSCVWVNSGVRNLGFVLIIALPVTAWRGSARGCGLADIHFS